MENKYKLFTDGGSRNNPGKAAGAAILFDGNDKLIDYDAKYIGIDTNNMGEYTGLLLGLNLALKHKCRNLIVNMDSELIVNQISGKYKVKSKELLIKYEEVKRLMKDFNSIEFTHILRKYNSYADRLVNIILDNS